MLNGDLSNGSRPPTPDPRPGARITVSLRRETYTRLQAHQQVRETLDALVRRLLAIADRGEASP